MTTSLLIAAAATPGAAAAVIALLRPGSPSAARWAVRATTVAFAAAVAVAVAVAVGGAVSAVIEGADGAAIVGLYADRIGAVLGLLTTGVGLVVQSFASRALQGDRRERRFFVFTTLLTAATTAVAYAATSSLLAVSWIVVSGSLAALVAHRGDWTPAVRAARRTRRSLLVGDAALAVAAALVLVSVGEIDLRSSQVAAEAMSRAELAGGAGAVLPVVAVLLTIAGVSRSALAPLHRWLPATLAAPTPVSALLHAGVVNGAGVLLVRLAPVFGESTVATHLAFAAGAVTAVYATTVMLVHSDVKGNLAWSTAGQMGFMTVQLAVGAFGAALFHIVGHGMYKAALFLGSGGAVSAHLRHQHRPAPRYRAPRALRLFTGLVVPGGALLVAYAVVNPHLPTAGSIIVVVFAWATAARAVDGWLRTAPFAPMLTHVVAWVGTVVGVFAYVAVLAVFEGFVAPSLPADVPAAVGSVVLTTTLAVVALLATFVWFAPGARGQLLRTRVYAAALHGGSRPGSGGAVVRSPSEQHQRPGPDGARSRPGSRSPETVRTVPMNGPRRDTDRVSQQHHTSLLADVARAAEIVAPMWPLTSFVAVNPLGGLQHLPFDEATATARRWLGARTHPTLAEYRAAHSRGAITDADLRRSIIEIDPTLASSFNVEIGGRSVDGVELVRLDLLVGPDNPPEAAPQVRGSDTGYVRAVDDLVSTWCGAYVDEAGVPWAMPGREHGLYGAWRQLAPHNRRLRRLAGRPGTEWLSQLPDRPVEALDAALAALDVDDNDRVDALRAQLGRLPGWASYAQWYDQWAPPDHHGHPFRLIELLTVQAATMAAVTRGRLGAGTRVEDEPGRVLLDERVEAVLSALGASPDDPLVASAVSGVLQQVPPATRLSIWLEAHEGNFRDRLLSLLTRLDPGQQTDTPDVQAAFCIDVRSEGLRRHLERNGRYETYGFAGFFGVPMRWRPFGSPATQPRCPVLVTPRHEVAERPLPSDDPTPYLATQRAARSGHEAFHAAKGGLGSPFALAEASGWLLGPLAAARTLTPSLVGRTARWARRVGLPRTRPAVDAENDSGSGLALEERALFAEAIVTTMGLTRFAPLIVLCGHGSLNVNNPHASSYDCGACGGAPGGASARTAAAILNDPAVRTELADRGITVPDGTWFAAAQHDTASDRVTVLDREAVPASHDPLVTGFERDVAEAGERLSRERARRLPGDQDKVRDRGHDWAQVRPEWGLAGNAAFVIGPRSITRDLDLANRVFLHSYDADTDPDGLALETILTAPLVVAQWISAQYYFSAVDSDVFGAGDKTLHNPVGGIGVVLGEGGDLQLGLPVQAVALGHERVHEPLRLLAVVQAPLARTEAIIRRNQVLQELIGGKWITVVGRSHGDERWSIRTPGGTWSTWYPADDRVDYANASLEVA